MHFKVFSLKRCYKWIFVFIFCISILTVSYAIKEKQNRKKQIEYLINKMEEIELFDYAFCGTTEGYAKMLEYLAKIAEPEK